MATKNKKSEESVDVLEVVRGRLECCILGTRPLVHNRLSEKTKRELLMPKGKKTAADKAVSLKHDPLAEFQASPYVLNGASTLIGIPSAAFKGAIMTAALDMPGMKKAQIGRLTYVNDDYVPVFGVPELFMAPVRSADMNRTPDIRTRAIMPKWACKISITFAKPLVREQMILRLLAAAGITVGVGDGRQEKGTFNFGLFQLVAANDPEFLAVVKAGGPKAQAEAMRAPACYDEETAELLSWFNSELKTRRDKGVAA